MFKTNAVTPRNVLFSIILAVITGLLVGMRSPIYGVAIIIFLAFFTFTLSNFRYGLIFWIGTGGILAIPLYTFRNAAIYPSIIILCLLFFIWIILSIEKGTLGITKDSLFWPLIVLALITILSSVQGVILYDPNVHGEHRFALVQIFAACLIIFSVISVFFIPRFFKTIEQIRLIYSAFIFLGIGLIICSLFGIPRFRWYIMIETHVVSLMYASLLFIPKLSIWKKIGFIILIIFSLEFIIREFINPQYGQWLAGWVAMGIPLIFITFQKSKKWSIFLLILFVALIFILLSSKINDIYALAEAERDYDRFLMWEVAMKIWLKRPFFGVGPGNYMDYILTYADPGFPYNSAHSQYFQILAELGGLGMICFSWIIVKIILLGKYLIYSVKDNFMKAIVVGMLGSIYGQLGAGVFADYILPAYHNGGVYNFQVTIYFWILVGSLIAIEQIVKKG